MLAIMIIVFCDVFMRYVFQSPLSWAYDLIAMYLLAAVFFLSLSPAYGDGAHVNVDILQQKLPQTIVRLTEIVTTSVGITVFSLIAWFGTQRAHEAFAAKDVLSGAIAWPTWPALSLVPLGCGVMAVRLAVHLAGHLASVATGRSIVPLRIGQHGAKDSYE